MPGDLGFHGRKPLRHMPMSPSARPGSVVQGKNYRLTVITDGLIRLEYAADGVFEDRASTFAINRNHETPHFKVIDCDARLEIVTERFHLVYDKSRFTSNGLSISIPLASIHDNSWKIPWRYGAKNAPTHGGTARTLDEADGRIPLEPGVLAGEGVSMLDDSRSMLFTDDDWIGTRRSGSDTEDRLDLYVFCFGHDYRAAMDSYYALSGSQPLLPRWAFGNWWSRYYAYTTEEYIKLMDRFREEGVPLSVAVLDMNWHLEDSVPKEYGTGWTGYTWDKSLFKDPAAFTAALHKRGLRVTANDHPADGIRAFEEQYPAMAQALGIDPTSKIPVRFDVTSRTFINAYFDVLHKKLEDEDGIDFWWLDWQQGPYSDIQGIDPLWILNHFDYLTNARKGRPMTFSRYGGPGAHRYPVGFSGDTVVSWASLAFQPEFTATASNIGYGYWSNDIGGHMQGCKDDELATRWVQLGVFSPINRLHSTLSQFNRKEPWTFNRDARAAMTKALRLRHRLVPYLYCLNVLAATKNEPLVVPMYWDHSGVEEAYWHKSQFYFGKQLIIAPITSPASKTTLLGSVKAYLPEGHFVDILSGQVYTGGRELWFHREYDTLPVLAKAGAMIPLDGDAAPENGCPLPHHIEIVLVVGEDGEFDLVEDDGSGKTASAVSFSTTRLSWAQADRTLTISALQGPNLLEKRAWTIRVKTLHCDTIKAESNGLLKTDLSHDGQDTVIKIDTVPTSAEIKVTLGIESEHDLTLAKFDISTKCLAMLDAAQMNYELKQKLMAVVNAGQSTLATLARLAGIEMPEDVRNVLMEYYLADAR